jgi:hypothetical protein
MCSWRSQRIRDILQRKQRQRQAKALAEAKKQATGDYSQMRDKNEPQLPMPTLPNVMLDDEDLDDTASMRTRGPAPSTYTAADSYYADQKAGGGYEYAMEYPPMPAYNPAQAQAYGYYAQPQAGVYADAGAPTPGVAYGTHEQYFQDENYSSTHLASHATPTAYYDPRDTYQHADHAALDYSGQADDRLSADVGLAYESTPTPSPLHKQSASGATAASAGRAYAYGEGGYAS